MDPNEALRRLREAAAKVREEMDKCFGGDPMDDVSDMLQHFEALDGWITNGGFLPAAWRRDG